MGRYDLTPTISGFRVRPDGVVPSFLPGQYLTLGLEAENRALLRPYSTASPRGEAEALEFLVRLVADGSLTPRLWRLGVGARLSLGRPKGLFTDDGSDPRRPLYVATGTGLAPIVAMVASRLRERPDSPRDRRPVVVHGVAMHTELCYRERLAAWASKGRITYVPVVSRPTHPANAGWKGPTGRLDALLPRLLADLGARAHDSIAWLCGNPGMVEAVRATLGALGMPADAVRTEAYWTPGLPSDKVGAIS